MDFENIYDDKKYAETYSAMEFPNCYYLAYRDIPEILKKHVHGNKAIDFGCGSGRSTRFLKKLGFRTTGIDISAEMIKKAKSIDPDGEYYKVPDGDFSRLKPLYFDLALSMFTFDNIPGIERRTRILKGLSNLLNKEGRIVLLDSTPEMYDHEWTSFSTKDFPENKNAKSGGIVRIINMELEGKIPVEDIIWFHEDYIKLFDGCGLRLVETHRPLGKPDEPYPWVNEKKIAPWVIYVLKKKLNHERYL